MSNYVMCQYNSILVSQYDSYWPTFRHHSLNHIEVAAQVYYQQFTFALRFTVLTVSVYIYNSLNSSTNLSSNSEVIMAEERSCPMSIDSHNAACRKVFTPVLSLPLHATVKFQEFEPIDG